MKSEIMKFISSKKSWVISIVIISIMLIENIVIFLQLNEFGIPKEEFTKFTHATFLVGESEGHIFQIILIWFLPIYMLLLYSDKIISEVKTNYFNIAIVKSCKRKYVINKILAGFIIGFSIMFIALILNLILSFILFNGGLDSFKSNYDIHPFRAWQNDNPLLTNIIYDTVMSIISGIIMSVTVLIAIAIKDKKITYICSFGIWFYLISKKGYSIVNVIQPYTEYGFERQVETFIQFILYFAIISVILIFIIARRKDYVQ